MGQTRKSGDAIATSALPPTADIPDSGCDVRKVPVSEVGPALFNRFGGAHRAPGSIDTPGLLTQP
jgi:hypothetical protein